jgi:hypothetical protein
VNKLVVGGLAAILSCGATAVIAGTPMGGDDLGIIPSSKTVAKCEIGVGKGAAKLAAGILKCHQSRVTGKLADETAEDGCESAAATKFMTKTKTTGCGPCTSLAGTATLVEGLIDQNNNVVYCAAGTPWGGDDTGNIPADAPKGAVAKCENVVAKGVSKLIGSIAKCHASRVSGKLADDTAEDACENTAIGKFTALGPKTTGCDVCTNLSSIATLVEMKSDQATGVVFCSSPSGAFLD